MDEIEPQLLEAFLASRPRARPRSYNHLLCVVRRLFDWFVAQGDLACSPVRIRPRRETARRIPFLFNAEQARGLLDAARHLPDTSNAPLRGHTYRTMFALLYGLGLRVGEVSRLCGGDVDLNRQLLVIRDTKFSKSRLVPFGPRIGPTAGRLSRAADRTSRAVQSRGAAVFVRWQQGYQPDGNCRDFPSAVRSTQAADPARVIKAAGS